MSARTGGPRVVVVGGGIGGLASAALLARGGARVTLLERHERVGGRAGTLTVDGFRFDTGPSWWFMPEVVEHTFALLGERVEDHVDLVGLDPAYRLFPEPLDGGRAEPFDVVADRAANLALFDRIEPGAGAAVDAYLRESSEAYRTALDSFLYTTFARPDRVASPDVVRRLPHLTRLLTQTLAERIAGTVQDPVLRQALGYHAVFLGSSPYRVPALYSLMSHLDLVDGVRYPRGGMYTLVEALERLALREGVEIRTGADVVRIDVEPSSGARGPRRPGAPRGWARAVELADGERVRADVVIAGGDRHHTETVLLDEPYQELPERRWSNRGPGISALLVLAGVRGELPELAHHSLLFTRDWRANFEAILGEGRSTDASRLRVPHPASLYVSRTTATDPTAAPPGHESLVVLVPWPADPSLGAGPDGRERAERHADRYLDQVGRWAGVPGLRERVVVRRLITPADFAEQHSAWRGTALGMEHTLAQSAMFRPGDASRRVGNLLHVGGGTVPGVGVPMVLISAELVVKRMLGETSTRPLPAPLRPGFLGAARPSGVWSRVASGEGP